MQTTIASTLIIIIKRRQTQETYIFLSLNLTTPPQTFNKDNLSSIVSSVTDGPDGPNSLLLLAVVRTANNRDAQIILFKTKLALLHY